MVTNKERLEKLGVKFTKHEAINLKYNLLKIEDISVSHRETLTKKANNVIYKREVK